MAGRLQRIDRRVLDSKQRLHSPPDALVASVAGGVGWEGESGAGEWVLEGLSSD